MRDVCPESKPGVNFWGIWLTVPDTYDINTWRRWPDHQLMREYMSLMKNCFPHNMFYRNARRALSLLARILVCEREVGSIPNIFGPIEIRMEFGWD